MGSIKRFFPLFITCLSVCLLSVIYIGKSSHLSGAFHLYLNQTMSLGVQTVNLENVTLTMNQGELNSSSSTLANDYMRGYLTFNSSANGNFTVTFSDQMNVWYSGQTGYLDTGTLINYAALSANTLYWDARIYDPFEDYFFPVIGLVGFIMTAASGFYTAQTIRNRDEDVMKYSYGIVLLILGIGFIMVWFYG